MEGAKNRIERAIRGVLDGVPVEGLGIGSDGTTHVRVQLGPDQSLVLRAFWAGQGWPGEVRAALDDMLQPTPWPPDLVVVARHLSPGSLKLLGERDANWVDEAGQAKIVAPGVLILREQVEARPREVEFAWSPSALAIAEALLSQRWPTGIRTSDLAHLTGWSLPQISQVLQAFDAQGWTVKYGPQRGPGASRELADPDGLLTAFAAANGAQDRERRIGHRTIRNVMDFLHAELAEHLNQHVRWALTGWAAAEEAAPFMTTVPSLQVYVHDEDFNGNLNAAMRAAELRDVEEGGRVEFIAAPQSALAMSTPHDGLRLASAPRVYADLLSMGGRGEDAAAHFKEEVIDPMYRLPGGRTPPLGLLEWEQECRKRLQRRLERELPLRLHLYEHGTWSASYRLLGITRPPDPPQFMAILREVAGRETGWPPWWVPDRSEIRPRPVAGMIECWLGADDPIFGDSAHADFWRADAKGRLCLIRGYQEDSPDSGSPPGTTLGITLPVWRTGECLLHAHRLSERLGATRVQFMMRWEGLEGRQLSAFGSPERFMPPGQECAQQKVTSYVEVKPQGITSRLPDVVRELVEPLYHAFDFFEPPDDFFDVELAKMQKR